MKKLLVLLLISGNVFAIFFNNFVPTPKDMMDFYNQNKPHMLPHFERENRLKDQGVDNVMDGEVEYLQVGNQKVFSIFIESEEDNKNAKIGVILLHSRGENPNDEKLIKPLRIDMAEQGYNTLSVQMPVLDKKAKYYDYVPLFSHSHPRIKAAIDFYKKKGIKDIIFVAHGCGAHMLMSYIDRYNDSGIKAIIGIGMGATDTGQEVVQQYPLATMKTPVLDIIGSKDYPSVKKHAQTRIPHLELGNKNNEQIIIKGNHHYHNEKGEFVKLTDKIYKFLSKIE